MTDYILFNLNLYIFKILFVLFQTKFIKNKQIDFVKIALG